MNPKKKGTDLATPIGIGLSLLCVGVIMVTLGINPLVLFMPPGPLILVLGGSAGAAMAGGFGKDFLNLRKVMKYAMTSPNDSYDDTIVQMVRLAEVARREGLLALDRESGDIEDPFFRQGIELTVDGIDPVEIESVLYSEIESLRNRHSKASRFFMDMGGFSPTLGILGTVIGLIKVLSSLSDPKTLGPAVAGAFVATLWGVSLANLAWIPIANKLKRVSEVEVTTKRLIMDGILAIQSGSSPRRIEQKLLTYIAPAERDGVARVGKAA